MTKLAFVDVETTGTDPAHGHSLWEIGLVLVSEEAEQRYCWQVMPDLSVADPMALRVGRFYERFRILGKPVGSALATEHPDVELQDLTAGNLAAELAPLLDGASLAAANVAFDAAFLAAFLRANGQCPTWDYHLVEIESYAAGVLGLEPPWKLNTLLDKFDVSVRDEDRHTALGDAQAIRDLWRQVRIHNRAAKMLASGCGVSA